MQTETEYAICQRILCLNNDKGSSYVLFPNLEICQQKKTEVLSKDGQTILVGDPYPTLVSRHTHQQVCEKGMVEGCYRNPPPRVDPPKETPICGAA